MRIRVHRAGIVEGNVQRCSRCGEVLIDSTGAMSMDGLPMSYWAEGEFIGTDGGCSFIMSRDAMEATETPCGPVQIQ